MIYRTDYHVHTAYSDGKGWPEEYIEIAIKSGLSEIGFSDHLTLTDEQQSWSMKPELLDEYVDRILKLRDVTTGIDIKLGLEVDYFHHKEDLIEKTISHLPFDYIIGSVHYMDQCSVDIAPDFYKNKDIDLLFEKYFKLISLAASSGLFDFMAHPDLIRIFRYYPAIDPEPLYRLLATELKNHNVAIEINTNGMNKPLHDFYPDRRYLHVFREEGVPVCVNSDAHNPGRIAQYFDEAYQLLIQAGYHEMITFKQREKIFKPILP